MLRIRQLTGLISKHNAQLKRSIPSFTVAYHQQPPAFTPTTRCLHQTAVNHKKMPKDDDKKKRKKKDPNAPKKNLSSYMIFATETRPIVLEENPGIAFGQVGKVLGEKWKALSPEEKKPYEQKAEQDKIRYQQEMEVYTGA